MYCDAHNFHKNVIYKFLTIKLQHPGQAHAVHANKLTFYMQTNIDNIFN